MSEVAAATEAIDNAILQRQQAQAEALPATVSMDTSGLTAVTDAAALETTAPNLPTTTTVEVVRPSPPLVVTEPAALGVVSVAAPELEEESSSPKKKSPRKQKGFSKRSAALKRPKRPRTAYHFFYDSRRKEELEKDPTRDNNELSKRLGEEWKELPFHKKQPYETDAAAAKAEYEAACRDYEAASGKKMEDCEPKKPLTAYMIFFQARHLQEKAKGADGVDDFSKSVGKEWKDMSEEAKQPYYDQSRESKEAHERQVAFLSRSKAELLGQSFVDLLRDNATATVASYDDDEDLYTLAYDASSSEPVVVSSAELRARVCGDDKASKRANKPTRKSESVATKTPRQKRKKSVLENDAEDHAAAATDQAQASTTAVAVAAAVAAEEAPSSEKKKRKQQKDDGAAYHAADAPWMTVSKDDAMAEDEMANVIRLSRRLVGGACAQNLKKICSALHLPLGGAKLVLATRLELFLRHHDFPRHSFLPSADDVDNLSIEAFNTKYESHTPHTVDHVIDVLTGLAKADDFVNDAHLDFESKPPPKLDDDMADAAAEAADATEQP
mmetsp:Transcript_17234/g.52378  ORF Transcript_17234/g.52378 Transcript_17234/m.52378 type:complete len:556 (+) Transcript_17234:108-1775(+)